MKELLQRLKLPTPAFFKKVQVFGGTIAAIGLAILGINSQYPEFVLIDKFVVIAERLVEIGTVIVVMAQTAVKPEVPNKDLP